MVVVRTQEHRLRFAGNSLSPDSSKSDSSLFASMLDFYPYNRRSSYFSCLRNLKMKKKNLIVFADASA